MKRVIARALFISVGPMVGHGMIGDVDPWKEAVGEGISVMSGVTIRRSPVFPSSELRTNFQILLDANAEKCAMKRIVADTQIVSVPSWADSDMAGHSVTGFTVHHMLDWALYI